MSREVILCKADPPEVLFHYCTLSGNFVTVVKRPHTPRLRWRWRSDPCKADWLELKQALPGIDSKTESFPLAGLLKAGRRRLSFAAEKNQTGEGQKTEQLES